MKKLLCVNKSHRIKNSNVFRILSSIILVLFVVLTLQPKTSAAAASGSGWIGRNKADYSWKAVENGEYIDWEFNITRRTGFLWSNLYLEFELPEYFESIEKSTIEATYNGSTRGATVNEYSSGRGFYIYSTQEPWTGRTLSVKFRTTITDTNRTDFGIDFKPAFRYLDYVYVANESAYNRGVKDNKTGRCTASLLKTRYVSANISFTPPAIENKGNLKIYKTDDSNKPLAGAGFRLTNNSTGQQYNLAPTAANGYTSIDNLPYGSYALKETQVPAGYEGAADRTVTIDKAAQEITVVNKVKAPVISYGQFKIYKTDDSNKPLAGAGFRLTNNSTGQQYNLAPTAANGYTSIDNLPYGSYALKETQVPAGYEGAADRTVTIDKAAQEITVVNKVKAPVISYGQFKIYKTDDNSKPLAGAGFRLTNNSTGQQYNLAPTAANGYTSIDNLPYGSYTLKETQVPAGYEGAADRTVTIDKAVQEITVVNKVKAPVVNYGTLRIFKKDEQGRALAGAGFKLVNNSNNTEYTAPITAADGITNFTNIPYGSYTLKETTVPRGYTGSPDIVININNTLLNIAVENKAIPQTVTPGTLRIGTADYDTLSKLPGVEYSLKNSSGQVVDSYTSDQNGDINISISTPGEYTLGITKVPEGYYQPEEGYKFTAANVNNRIQISYNGQQISYFEIRISKLVIIESFNIPINLYKSSGTPISNVNFELLTRENQLVTTGMTDNNGYLIFQNIDPGNYAIRQLDSSATTSVYDKIYIIVDENGQISLDGSYPMVRISNNNLIIFNY